MKKYDGITILYINTNFIYIFKIIFEKTTVPT